MVRGETVVAIHHLITTGESGPHSFGAKGVIHARADIDGSSIVENADFCALAGRLSFVGHGLDQLCDWCSLGPSGIVEAPIDGYLSLAQRGVC
ncbi:MAG: hypothetical protein ABI408_00445 [Gemmatimonadaceae bacterium]